MPVNIPFDKPVSQDLYTGTSEQQVDALTDLLMHFDAFAKQNLSLEAYLRQQPAAPAANLDPAKEQATPAVGTPQALQPSQQPPKSAAAGQQPDLPSESASRRLGVALK